MTMHVTVHLSGLSNGLLVFLFLLSSLMPANIYLLLFCFQVFVAPIGCKAQDQILNLAYTLGAFINGFTAFIWGFLLDRWGLRKVRLIIK